MRMWERLLDWIRPLTPVGTELEFLRHRVKVLEEEKVALVARLDPASTEFQQVVDKVVEKVIRKRRPVTWAGWRRVMEENLERRRREGKVGAPIQAPTQRKG